MVRTQDRADGALENEGEALSLLTHLLVLGLATLGVAAGRREIRRTLDKVDWNIGYFTMFALGLAIAAWGVRLLNTIVIEVGAIFILGGFGSLLLGDDI